MSDEQPTNESINYLEVLKNIPMDYLIQEINARKLSMSISGFLTVPQNSVDQLQIKLNDIPWPAGSYHISIKCVNAVDPEQITKVSDR